MRRGRLADRADRPVGRNPFAGGMNERRRKFDQAALAVDGGGLNRCDLVLAQAFSDQIEAGGKRRLAKAPHPLAREVSGFWISACALASAAASAPTLWLERCMAGLRCQNLKADGAGF